MWKVEIHWMSKYSSLQFMMYHHCIQVTELSIRVFFGKRKCDDLWESCCLTLRVVLLKVFPGFLKSLLQQPNIPSAVFLTHFLIWNCISLKQWPDMTHHLALFCMKIFIKNNRQKKNSKFYPQLWHNASHCRTESNIWVWLMFFILVYFLDTILGKWVKNILYCAVGGI